MYGVGSTGLLFVVASRRRRPSGWTDDDELLLFRTSRVNTVNAQKKIVAAHLAVVVVAVAVLEVALMMNDEWKLPVDQI
jgi:hypothetical protein